MQWQQSDVVSLWCIQQRLYSLCATARSLYLVLLLLCCSCSRACRTAQSTCLATTENTGMRKIHQRQKKVGSICIFLAAFVCEILSFIFMWFSLVTKAPGALLSTEQQGIAYAWKIDGMCSINTEATHFKSARSQAGSMLYPIRANLRVQHFASQSGQCQMLYREKLTMEADKSISVHDWELIAEDWSNTRTLCLALYPNSLLLLITTLHIVDGSNLLEVFRS